MASCALRWRAIPSDNSNGFIWDLAWLYRYTNGAVTLTPGIGVQYSSENYNDYYYGVSKAESRRSGLNSYSADDGWDPYRNSPHRITSSVTGMCTVLAVTFV